MAVNCAVIYRMRPRILASVSSQRSTCFLSALLILALALAPYALGDDLHHGAGVLGGFLHGGAGHGGLGVGIGGYLGEEILHGGAVHFAAPVYHSEKDLKFDYKAPAHYTYDYGIDDAHLGTNFGHAESRDGYKTKGVYYVHLPDGRLQTVKYYVDEHGYHPEVTYSGVAHHDTGILHHHPEPYH
ncbi:cuticle protein 8-like [Penaeus indicus]|uniref:cuticle protein 8-like n=1 Tax=Penaeus indicus TaxID=29960 RepID=UPI00300DA95C